MLVRDGGDQKRAWVCFNLKSGLKTLSVKLCEECRCKQLNSGSSPSLFLSGT